MVKYKRKRFIEEEILPIVLNNIENETQEEKIKYIINGLATSIKEDIAEEDLIISYYDILNKLRKVDINMLIDLYKQSKQMCSIFEDETDDTINNEYEAAEVYIVRKLESLTLISVEKTFNDLQGKMTKPKKSSISISKLGKCFVEFFNMYVEKDDCDE